MHWVSSIFVAIQRGEVNVVYTLHALKFCGSSLREGFNITSYQLKGIVAMQAMPDIFPIVLFFFLLQPSK